MGFAGPPPLSRNPVRILWGDLSAERRVKVPFPPGETWPSVTRTRRMAFDPLPLMLESYERYGPVFTLRIFHSNVILMLGPEANHYMTVSHPENFCWREGHMGDLVPLLGDGLLTIDGDFHRRSRRVMLPAFHREHIARSVQTMVSETERAIASWSDGMRVDLYSWARRLAMRIALRALFGIDPDDRPSGAEDPAALFERALSFYSRDYFMQVLRGPGSPFARMQAARARLDTLIYGEIERRRRTGGRGEDILSLLMDARDEEGHALSDLQIRDEVMTLLFAGHDTTTSTVAFLFHELASHPEVLERLVAERDRVVGDRTPTADDLVSGELAELEMALDETLRMYPPAWVGPRRSVRDFEFAGCGVPGGVPVNYSSWATHHLPEVFPDPETFRPERFAPAAKAALPKGAYVPFGAGSRICIGMRFGQLEIKAIAAMVLSRFALQLAPGYRLRIRQMPTIGPRGGMWVTVRARRDAANGALAIAA
jgi:cytochrome P450